MIYFHMNKRHRNHFREDLTNQIQALKDFIEHLMPERESVV